VDDGGKHPIIYRLSTRFNHPGLVVQDFATIHRMLYYMLLLMKTNLGWWSKKQIQTINNFIMDLA